MKKDICIFGASITWGAWDSEKSGWANRLRLFLEENHENAFVYNLGIPGDTTEDVLARLKNESEAREADVIIFSIGTNDSLYNGSRDNPRTTIERFKENIRKTVTEAKKFTDKIIFTGLTNVDESLTAPMPGKPEVFYDNENVALYSRAIEEICQAEKIAYLEMIGVLKEADFADGLHPNAKGHEKMFQRIKDFIMKEKLVT